jgi:riboflavin kinase/FMN adenylyltransferase
MRVFEAAHGLGAAGERVCLAIGVFDGVHLGHQQLIRQTVAEAIKGRAQAVVVTFDRHPNAVVAPERVPPAIYSIPQKLRAIATLGVDAAWLMQFDQEFSRQPGEEFVRSLARHFARVESVSVGSEFTFGYQRSGNVDLLRRLGGELGFAVRALAEVSLESQIVSSTRIREAIRAGDFPAASQMLGRPYALAGRVERGDQRGRTLGFPTANLALTGLALPPLGVYPAQARIIDQNGSLPAVVNIGWRPTLREPAPTLHVEAHLLDYAGDLYGLELELEFRPRLRPEQTFPNLTALQAQIAADVDEARRVFAAETPASGPVSGP